MSIKDLDIATEYRSFKNDIVKEFYIPILREATEYKRAVGFFSSTSLIEISYGITGLIANNGNIKLIVSPKLSKEDVEAIDRGYELQEKVIEDALLRELYQVDDYYAEKRLNLLAKLISDGVLDIKVATVTNKSGIGMYHEKIGIVKDSQEYKLAFSGSLNESVTALKHNYESIDVFCSWTNDSKRVELKDEAFERLWNNIEKNVEVKSFPNVDKEIINKYSSENIDADIDLTEFGVVNNYRREDSKWFRKPDSIDFYEYQKEAINEWERQSFRGIFDMATGTGKTLTSLGAIERLSEKVSGHLFVVIVCPYQHLVEQWIEDINSFGVNPLICYSAYSWKRKLKELILDYNIGITENSCVITTNATFVTDSFQDAITKTKGDLCLVVDEAHNFGSRKQRECMKDIYKYRLALSATLERYRDEIGTESLYNFFGAKCIEYSLEMAIKADKLTPYYYYPILINLEDDEYTEYMAQN